MPQLDFATYPSQFLWLIVIFLLQYLVISKLIVPAFKKLYKGRQNSIDSDIKSAEDLIRKAENLRNDYETKLLEAREHNSKLLNKTASELQANMDKQIQELELKLSTEMKAQRTELDQLLKNSQKDLEKMSLESAALIIKNITAKEVEQNKLTKYMH